MHFIILHSFANLCTIGIDLFLGFLSCTLGTNLVCIIDVIHSLNLWSLLIHLHFSLLFPWQILQKHSPNIFDPSCWNVIRHAQALTTAPIINANKIVIGGQSWRFNKIKVGNLLILEIYKSIQRAKYFTTGSLVWCCVHIITLYSRS